MDFDSAAIVLAWVAIALLAFAMAGMLRQVQILTTRNENSGGALGPAVGTKLRVTDGVVDTEANLSILLFLDTNCEACGWVLPQVADSVVRDGAASVRALYKGAVSNGKEASVEIIGEQEDVFRRLGISATPFAVGVTPSGRVVASDVIGSPAGLQAFLALAVERSEQR